MAAETIKKQQISKQITKRKKPTSKKLLELRTEKGLSEREIAALTGIPKTTIHTQLQELVNTTEYRDFQSNKDKVFEGLQLKLINLADHDLLKTMLSKRGMTDVAILQDKIQQLRGQETPVNLTQIRVLIDQRPQEAAQTVDVIPICSGDEDISRLCQLPIVPETA